MRYVVITRILEIHDANPPKPGYSNSGKAEKLREIVKHEMADDSLEIALEKARKMLGAVLSANVSIRMELDGRDQ